MFIGKIDTMINEQERKCPECGSTHYKIQKRPNGYTSCLDCKRIRLHTEFWKLETNELFYQDKYDEAKYIDASKPGIITAKGGDGTLLKAINKFRHLNKPFFGIGAGTENFLMNESEYFSDDAKYKVFNLIKVKVTYSTPNQLGNLELITKEYQAFNEIFISEENGWINFNCHDKDYILGKFKGSGLIISTPQGSTGINKNNNGVILPLSSKDWSITGDKTNRKINYVLEQKKISISVKSRGTVNLFIDGKNEKIANISKVEISKGDSVYLIFNDYTKFKRKRIL